ncbi:restriction endonuclease subunit S [Pontibacterium sp.]|uniref:restriction endonuclease subunit S n=1 Tax=Pontibacterium sp. TaxID=2036026 RepID=UPI0035183760
MSWPLVAIKDVAKVVTGKTPSKKNPEFFGGSIPFVTPAEIGVNTVVSDAPQTLTERGADKVKLVPEGAVLVCCIGSLGKTSIAGRELATNQQINSVVFDPRKVDSRYGYYACKRLKPKLELMAPATTVSIVNKSNFESLEIPLPPLAEQQRIAAILDKTDTLRRKRQQAIDLADQFLRSVFLEMFGDPVINPKEWETRKLGDLILSGPSNGLYKPAKDYGEGTRILRIDGFYNGALEAQSKLKRVRLSEKEVEKYELEENSIVINRVNSREYLGKCALIEGVEERTVFESNMMNFTVDQSLAQPGFIVDQLCTPYVKGQILKSCKDAVNQSSINQQDVKSLELRIPPLELQKKYLGLVGKTRGSIKSMQSLLDESTNLSASLSQQAFSGEL